jgi:hypothetical protein
LRKTFFFKLKSDLVGTAIRKIGYAWSQSQYEHDRCIDSERHAGIGRRAACRARLRAVPFQCLPNASNATLLSPRRTCRWRALSKSNLPHPDSASCSRTSPYQFMHRSTASCSTNSSMKGGRVKKGELLAKIDRQFYRAALNQPKAIETAQTNLDYTNVVAASEG